MVARSIFFELNSTSFDEPIGPPPVNENSDGTNYFRFRDFVKLKIKRIQLLREKQGATIIRSASWMLRQKKIFLLNEEGEIGTQENVASRVLGHSHDIVTRFTPPSSPDPPNDPSHAQRTLFEN